MYDCSSKNRAKTTKKISRPKLYREGNSSDKQVSLKHSISRLPKKDGSNTQQCRYKKGFSYFGLTADSIECAAKGNIFR